MIERDKVACIVGEISSASGLDDRAGRRAHQEPVRQHRLQLRRAARQGLQQVHVPRREPELDVREDGRAARCCAKGLVKGKKWFSLTADYAFGHDLLRVAKRFMERQRRPVRRRQAGADGCHRLLALLLEIRSAKPDLVISNLAGNQITNFLKQYSEFGLDFPVAGFGFDTAVAWGAGKGNFFGTWPLVWHHLIDTPGSKKFVADFTKRYKQAAREPGLGRLHRARRSSRRR